MKNISILDCTLRDGAYLINKKFGDATIRGIVDGLMSTGIECIEIGFFQNDDFGEGKTVYKNSADAKRYVPWDKQGRIFTVLADYSRYDISNLDIRDSQSIDAVRVCFFKNEREDVLDFCQQVKAKGYLLFVQPVDILGYTDHELLDLLEKISEIEPYCFSIVDTFGSMYLDDLQRVFNLVNNNLPQETKIGFHSHNNMQMSNALSQEFIRLVRNCREAVVDTTIMGMGRGAGNTPTELLLQYMTKKLGYNYNIDALLDTIDIYMEHIRHQCSWGYSIPYFIAGSYSAHINNVTYLTARNSIRSKDIRYILNKVGKKERKRYNYSLLEDTYINYLKANIDDSKVMFKLRMSLKGKNVLVLAPGKSIELYTDQIKQYRDENEAVVIAVNFLPKMLYTDYLYFSNTKRYDLWKNSEMFFNIPKILTSNIQTEGEIQEDNHMVVNFNKLIRNGWNYIDNSVIMLFRLLDILGVGTIGLAGMDGYSDDLGENNYVVEELESYAVKKDAKVLNREIGKMMKDFMMTRKSSCSIVCITPTRIIDMGLDKLNMRENKETEEKEEMKNYGISQGGYYNRIVILNELTCRKAVVM